MSEESLHLGIATDTDNVFTCCVLRADGINYLISEARFPMNANFAQYTTGTAFSINLSKLQCNALLRVDAAGEIDGTFKQWCDSNLDVLQVGTLRPLEARGLVFWHRKPDGSANGFGGLTAAGRLTVGLLKEAGLTIENTNTVSVLKRLIPA